MSDQQKAIIIATISLFAIAASSVMNYTEIKDLKKKNSISQDAPTSSNILLLTTPVNSFAGSVDKVEGNRITIKQSQYVTDAKQSDIPLYTKPRLVTISYIVTIPDSVEIIQPPSLIYLLKMINPPPQIKKLSRKDIKVGDNIIVETKSDLRILVDSQFEATKVTIPSPIHSYNGRIQLIEANILTIRGYLKDSNTGESIKKELSFKLVIDSKENDTEVSHQIYGDGITLPKIEKVPFNELKFQTQVTVYADSEYTDSGKMPTALRIDPIVGSAVTAQPGEWN